jgi:hypothetical protein
MRRHVGIKLFIKIHVHGLEAMTYASLSYNELLENVIALK